MKYMSYLERNFKLWFYGGGHRLLVSIIGALLFSIRGITATAIQITTTPIQQSSLFHCATADYIRNLLVLAENIVLLAVVVVILFIVFMNFMSSFSNILMHVSEFFNQRLNSVFWFLIFYIVFIWRLDQAVASTPEGCGYLDPGCAFTRGPWGLILLGKVLGALGTFTCNA